MKRFALLFNQLPHRFKNIPWVIKNMDCVRFKEDVENLNEYEAIWVYAMSGADTTSVKYCHIPEYLRKRGVKDSKILYQEDYFAYPWDWTMERYWQRKAGKESSTPDPYTHFSPVQVLPFVDAIVQAGGREWGHLKKPVYYVQWPIIATEKFNVPFNKKRKAAIGVHRFYGNDNENIAFSQELDIKFDCFGANIERRKRAEYLEHISKYKIALDYNEYYLGWSRFVAEATYAGVPVVGPKYRKGVVIANPDLAGPSSKTIPVVERLLDDEEYYIECVEMARKNIEEHLSPEACGKRIENIIEDILSYSKD